MFTKESHGIKVTAMPVYVPEQSFPEENLYTWIYHIIIENQGTIAIQLLSRYWKIINGYGEVNEVRGKGVVGEQPVIVPGAAYEYTSSCQLRTNSGIMQGEYYIKTLAGKELAVEIPAFSLDTPHDSHTIN